jgi:type II secretory pathway pseudopilin PulG
VELIASIVIIALLAALATPSFIAMMRDRRVAQVGVALADTYREARSRSLARGIAVAVRWQSDGAGKGTISIRETIVLPPGQGTTKACHTADWSSGSADTREVAIQNFAVSPFELASIQLFSEAGAGSPFGETCFAPDGRTHVRYSDAGVFLPLTGVPRFEVTNTRTQLKRTVYLPPNGVARVAL